ncbi:AcvB/VirJ family lysyl-phosphatidylglycerol hydrolase [Pseudaminobacter soli (ex Li et al. 2025)]|uniref:virulence factor family protein n=1 Tax=Pseudaminobacter soli (ex Li et al. 2025) TaxID=1295366 RepID=UPI003CD032C0
MDVKRFLGFSLASFCLLGVAGSAPGASIDTGLIPSPRIVMPDDTPKSTVFLFSDKTGWSASEDDFAQGLSKNGAIVIGVDLPRYLKAIEKVPDDCAYLVSDIENISHQAQRAANSDNYNPPILAGVGQGGGLVMAIAAQTPAATIGHSVAVDPTVSVPLAKTLCSGAPRKVTPQGTVYDLAEGALPNPIDVTFTPEASADGRSHIEDLHKQGFDITIKDAGVSAQAALEASLTAMVGNPPASAAASMPIVALPAKPTHDTMAIVYSGDGGWRDLDKSVADVLQSRGIPTVGVDSLRYFWAARTPQDVAKDLHELMTTYTEQWKVKHVILVGYSFGADIMPATFNALSDDDKKKVRQISLLGFSPQADFEISVAGWLGSSSSDAVATMPELGKIDPKLIQCFYGQEEDDTACPQLEGHGPEVFKTTGGHHFDGDYPGLAAKIIDGLEKRLDQEARATP